MTRHVPAATATFTGASGNRLVGDVFGQGGEPVLLLHGGGQTRHAWARTAGAIVATGYVAYALDQRGHGESEWVADGAYAFADFAGDAAVIAEELARRHGVKPVAIGASLGGIATLLAEGKAAREARSLFAALVLVDITPRVDPEGVARIHSFMRAYAKEGFATIDEAARAVAEYLPHRPRPKSQEGLKKNLRLSSDGRWRWHWDPRFLDGPRTVAAEREAFEDALAEASRHISIPTLLVRGASSELVKDEHVRDFLQLMPHATYVDVGGARHMVAGDENDRFSSAVVGFLRRLGQRSA